MMLPIPTLGAGSFARPPKIDAQVARRIRWVGLDVDGVLTDGGIYLGDVAGQRLNSRLAAFRFRRARR